MGMFSKRIKEIFSREKIITRYIRIPTLYPMGDMTFVIACSHCKNSGSSMCLDCKSGKKSEFEAKSIFRPKSNFCVSCGTEIPEGSHVCNKCIEEA